VHFAAYRGKLGWWGALPRSANSNNNHCASDKRCKTQNEWRVAATICQSEPVCLRVALQSTIQRVWSHGRSLQIDYVSADRTTVRRDDCGDNSTPCSLARWVVSAWWSRMVFGASNCQAPVISEFNVPVHGRASTARGCRNQRRAVQSVIFTRLCTLFGMGGPPRVVYTDALYPQASVGQALL